MHNKRYIDTIKTVSHIFDSENTNFGSKTFVISKTNPGSFYCGNIYIVVERSLFFMHEKSCRILGQELLQSLKIISSISSWIFARKEFSRDYLRDYLERNGIGCVNETFFYSLIVLHSWSPAESEIIIQWKEISWTTLVWVTQRLTTS